ncbi:MAG: hypothetical protein U1E13_10585, partial [Methylophilaceae bacterium]|nr:hypothetical protein [Methylophilaceae bacterium]
SLDIQTTSSYGSANGGNGGNAITGDGSNAIHVVHCLIEKTGNGGTGYVGSEINPNFPGNGGNGGNGILLKSNCTNTQISSCTIHKTGVSGARGGSSATSGISGHGILSLGQGAQIDNNTIAYTGSKIDITAIGGLAISCIDTVDPIVYSNLAHHIAASPAYFFTGGAAVDSPNGTAFTAITYPLQNIYK